MKNFDHLMVGNNLFLGPIGYSYTCVFGRAFLTIVVAGVTLEL
jgi:hypothetical protein